MAAAEPAEESTPTESAELNVQPVDDTETQDAIDALLGEASEEPVEEVADTGGQDLPQGPPLTGGEIGQHQKLDRAEVEHGGFIDRCDELDSGGAGQHSRRMESRWTSS